MSTDSVFFFFFSCLFPSRLKNIVEIRKRVLAPASGDRLAVRRQAGPAGVLVARRCRRRRRRRVRHSRGRGPRPRRRRRHPRHTRRERKVLLVLLRVQLPRRQHLTLLLVVARRRRIRQRRQHRHHHAEHRHHERRDRPVERAAATLPARAAQVPQHQRHPRHTPQQRQQRDAPARLLQQQTRVGAEPQLHVERLPDQLVHGVAESQADQDADGHRHGVREHPGRQVHPAVSLVRGRPRHERERGDEGGAAQTQVAHKVSLCEEGACTLEARHDCRRLRELLRLRLLRRRRRRSGQLLLLGPRVRRDDGRAERRDGGGDHRGVRRPRDGRGRRVGRRVSGGGSRCCVGVGLVGRVENGTPASRPVLVGHVAVWQGSGGDSCGDGGGGGGGGCGLLGLPARHPRDSSSSGWHCCSSGGCVAMKYRYCSF
eukprot:Rhum_TRINITY_DN13492_c0_g1::Rhum_TRINITY_DN13492_c0_g1_i1::g.60449::m.60449